jgi:hypothetical protein
MGRMAMGDAEILDPHTRPDVNPPLTPVQVDLRPVLDSLITRLRDCPRLGSLRTHGHARVGRQRAEHLLKFLVGQLQAC